IDFNGDGLADVLLRNLYTGEISAWLMNNAGAPQVVSYGTVPPSTGWTLIGAGDVNGDGCTDLLWVNSGADPQTRGGLVSWTPNGPTVLQFVFYGTIDLGAGWAPIDIYGFNGDGTRDLLLYNGLTGELSVWFLSGAGLLQTASYGTMPPTTGFLP